MYIYTFRSLKLSTTMGSTYLGPTTVERRRKLILPLLLVAWHSTETTTTATLCFTAMFAASAQIMMDRRQTQYCLRRWASLPHGSNSAAIVDDYEDEEQLPAARLFFRFSPLIGGPSFLPLHVEVIVVLDENGNFGSYDGRHCAYDIALSKRRLWSNAIHYFAMVDDDLSSSSSIAEFLSTTTEYYAQGRRRTVRIKEIHRFDYLPINPTHPSTLVRLVTFQSVPGQICHRRIKVKDRRSSCSLLCSVGDATIVSVHDDDERYDIKGGTTTTRDKQRDKGVAILIPVGCVSGYVNVISTAMKYIDEYHEQLYAELRIVGGKNCLSFALDLLSYIKKNQPSMKTASLGLLEVIVVRVYAGGR
jgi:hypothetical protein